MSIIKKTVLVTAGVVVAVTIAACLYEFEYGSWQTLFVPKPVPAMPVLPPTVAEIAVDVNLEREKAGFSPLIADPKLDSAAQSHCNDMLAANVYSHNMPDGRTPLSYILAQYGKGYSFTYGENNSYGWATSAEVVAGWMNSPGHKVNILDSRFTREGLGVCKATNFTAPDLPQIDGYLVVQIFTSDFTQTQQTVAPVSRSTTCSSYVLDGVVHTYCN